MLVRALALASLLLPALLSAAGGLTPAETRGRDIYLHGRAPDGRTIGALFGREEGSEIDASVVPCASCHGPDGRGVAEGTVVPSDIRWSVLAKSFVAVEGARRRVAYDREKLVRAVREAVDPSGTPFTAIMPRYRIDDTDLSDLVAYLLRLGDEPQPGLDDTTITIATVVPLSGPHAAAGNAVRDVLAGYFADVNAMGGLFGRSLSLEAIDAAAPAERIAAALSGDVFAVAVATWSDDDALDQVIRADRIPLVTPVAGGADGASLPSAFFLFPGLDAQALALLDFAAEGGGKRVRRVAVIRDESRSAAAAAAAVARRCETLGWPLTEAVGPDFTADDLVLLIGGGVDAHDIAAEVEGPRILIAGAAMTPALFDLKGKTIFVAAPTAPGDVTDEGRREVASFAERHRLGAAHRTAAIAAYAAAKVLVEGIRRSGHDVAREKLIASLERMYQFPTGLTPPVTWAPGRHVGAIGAYVVAVDSARRTFVRASDWITPAE